MGNCNCGKNKLILFLRNKKMKEKINTVKKIWNESKNTVTVNKKDLNFK